MTLQGLHKIDAREIQGMVPSAYSYSNVYKIATSSVETIEAKINKYARKWLVLTPGLSDVAMY